MSDSSGRNHPYQGREYPSLNFGKDPGNPEEVFVQWNALGPAPTKSTNIALGETPWPQGDSVALGELIVETKVTAEI